MPQMMPMIWFMMMIFFIFCLLMIMSLLYFLNISKLSLTLKQPINNLHNWKWMW